MWRRSSIFCRSSAAGFGGAGAPLVPGAPAGCCARLSGDVIIEVMARVASNRPEDHRIVRNANMEFPLFFGISEPECHPRRPVSRARAVFWFIVELKGHSGEAE